MTVFKESLHVVPIVGKTRSALACYDGTKEQSMHRLL